MRTVTFADVTMKNAKTSSFRKKLELAKLLDKLNVAVIEMPAVTEPKTDWLLIRSVASAVKNGTVAVPVDALDKESPAYVWNALKDAAHPRLQVALPVSTVQMEYFYHKKEDGMLKLISDAVSACKALCNEVEFIALDAARADAAFLNEAVKAAEGASVITVCDTAGNMLPEEYRGWIASVKAEIPEGVRFGVHCPNTLKLADACTAAAVAAGADEVKASIYGSEAASLVNVASIVSIRQDTLGARTDVRTTELARMANAVRDLMESENGRMNAFGDSVPAAKDEAVLTASDDQEAVAKAAEKLGYELSPEDVAKVYEAFARVAKKKGGQVSIRELDAIVASAALQVPPAYRLESYLINSGNIITATAHICLIRDGHMQEGLSVGDGPVDAAFRAIEQILGCHYELDDFQLRAVTEGREAMGEAVVRLRSAGKLYSGRGISTDIIGATIHAYIAAVNKIVYEEAAE